MTTSLGTIQVLRKYTVSAAIFGLLALPALASGQEAQESSTGTTGYQESTTPSAGASTGSPIWGNSAASSVGATSINPSASSASSAANPDGQVGVPGAPGTTPGTGAGGTTPRGTIRLRPGATADGRDPGGNPDVPFDPNMNLCFLVAGIVFSVWVVRKKYVLKPAVSNQ